MKITDVKLFRISGQAELRWAGSEERIARPLDLYPPFRDEGPSGERKPRGGVFPVRHVFVEVLTDEGLTGLYGPISTEQAFIIHHRLRPFLTGRDPLSGELLWDQMSRLDRHGRAGHGEDASAGLAEPAGVEGMGCFGPEQGWGKIASAGCGELCYDKVVRAGSGGRCSFLSRSMWVR